MRKGLSLVLLAALLCVALVGCGNKEATPDASATAAARNRLATLQAGALPTSTSLPTTPQPATATSSSPAAQAAATALEPTLALTSTLVAETPASGASATTPAGQATSTGPAATTVPGASATPGPSATATSTAGPTATTPVGTPVALTNQIAFVSNRDGNNEIYRMNADGSGVTRLTTSPADDQCPAWSPDGQYIVFASSELAGSSDIYVMNADGSYPRRLTTSPSVDTFPAWSPDGQYIAYMSDMEEPGNADNPGNYDIYVMKADGSEIRRLTSEPGEDTNPTWSPDGTWIAFLSDREGEFVGLYKMNSDGTNVIPLTVDVDLWTYESPSWYGSRLIFSDGLWMYTVNDDGTGLRSLTPEDAPYWDSSPTWSPDGTRIVLVSDRDTVYGDGTLDIYTMNADGSQVNRLTDNAANDVWPVWQPQ